MLKLGLHADIELLRSEVYRNIGQMAEFSDGILIFYGNCGDSLKHLEADFRDLDCPLYFLRDKKGEIVDDCISTALGGNDAYAEAMLSGNGTGVFYLTPMWASSWKDMKKESIGSLDFDKRYLKDSRYGKVARINTGIFNDDELKRNVLDFARTFDMDILEMKGSMEVASRSYLNARNGICKK